MSASALGRPLRLDDVLGREARRSDSAHLAGSHKIIERQESLADLGVIVIAVDLVEVDVIGAKPAQTVLDLARDPATRSALHVRIVAERQSELRRQNDILAATFDGLPDNLFGFAERIDIRGIEKIDARIDGAADDADRVFVVGVAHRAEHHGAESKLAHRPARSAEYPSSHFGALRRAKSNESMPSAIGARG